MQTNQRRNGKIEFLRFVFCLTVMFFHSKYVMNDGESRIMFSGRLGVEFFFLVSGYLMAASLAKIYHQDSPIRIAKETERFLLKKIKVLYPMVVIAFFMTRFMILYTGTTTLFGELKKIVQGIPNLFLMQQTGIQFYAINGTWYLSSMLIAMAILFPLVLKHYQFMRKIGVGLIAFLLIGYMMQATDSLSGPDKIIQDITYRGNIRALSELALGMLCYEGAMYLRTIEFTKAGLVFLKIFEIILYGVSILYMLIHTGSRYDYFILLFLAAAITITFSECSYNQKLWNKPIFSFLGKSSLYIYLAHPSVARDLTFIVGENASNVVRMAVFIILSLIATAFLWITSIGWKKISAKIGRLIVKPQTVPNG